MILLIAWASKGSLFMIGGEFLMEGGPDTRRNLVLKRRKRQIIKEKMTIFYIV